MPRIIRNERNLYYKRRADIHSLTVLDKNKIELVRSHLQDEPFITEPATITYAEYERYQSPHEEVGLSLQLKTNRRFAHFNFTNTDDISRVMQDFEVKRISNLRNKPAVLYIGSGVYFLQNPICMSAPPALDCRTFSDSTPALPPHIADEPVESYLGLSTRALKCLHNQSIHTVRDLVQQTAPELLELGNFGRVSLKEVTEKLELKGLSLKTK